jgi:SAM-dependent methyltransferase
LIKITEGYAMPPAKESYDEKFFEPLMAIEDRHFWFRSRNQLISNLIQKYCGAYADAAGETRRGLEIGCGTGNVLKFLQKSFSLQHISGVDLFIEGLQFARSRGAENLIQADIYQAPFSGGFDWIGLFDIIEHLDDDVDVLEKISGLLNAEGKLFISVPAFPVLWSYFDVAGKHKRRYTVKTLQEALNQAGLALEFASYTNVMVFPMLWFLRRVLQGGKVPETLSEQELDNKTNSELRIIPLVNEMVAFVLWIEGKLIQWGVKMPFGTSLIAVARRKN